MKNLSFDSSLPSKIGMHQSFPTSISTFAKIEGNWGDTEVRITDSSGALVKPISISDLNHWFDISRGRRTSCELKAGHVVHWQIRQRDGPVAIIEAFKNVNRALNKAQPEVMCILNSVPKQFALDYSWVVFGSYAVTVPAHQDMLNTASWNLLMTGNKSWHFWKPKQNPLVDTPTLELSQRAKDLIWIPEGWWHAVEYETASICLTQNLIPERAVQSVFNQAQISAPKLASIIEVVKKLNAEEKNV